MLEAQSLRTEAGVKSKKRTRSMFAGLKGFVLYCRIGMEKMNQNVSRNIYERSKESKNRLFSVVTKGRGCK